jgi:hypothetical protein
MNRLWSKARSGDRVPAMGRVDMKILVGEQCTVIFDGTISYAPA